MVVVVVVFDDCFSSCGGGGGGGRCWFVFRPTTFRVGVFVLVVLELSFTTSERR